MRVVSVAEMRELERLTFAAGVSEAELQRRAGIAVAGAIAEICPSPGSVVALVGRGNNGRDAWIAAAELQSRGWPASLYLSPRHAIEEPELRAFREAGGELIEHPDAAAPPAVQAAQTGRSVVIDGLLGIGGSGAPRSPLAELIDALNAARARDPNMAVVAVDAPSGVDADTGAAAGPAVQADATVVLGGAKRGLLTAQAARWTGRLVFADIGVVDGPPGAAEVLTAPTVRGLLPKPPPDAHKGSFGRLLVVAGSERYVGACSLVCAAAVRAGAGIVTLAAPRWLRDVVASRLPEITYLPLPDGGPADEPDACLDRISRELGSSTALAVGPGLSTEGGVASLVEGLLRERARRGIPAVVDADGLNCLAARPGWQTWIADGVVMTPHLGELRRLADAGEVDVARPWDTAGALAAAWGVTLVIKGPFTAIGSGDRSWVHAGPNPALATAGTGDVLTGIIGGLLARGLAPPEAARLGVWTHGAAGAAACAGLAAGGLMASDLLGAIPPALAATLA